MHEAVQPAVQVVTVSDWPTIVLGIVTGIVGLAGIGGTLWSGKRSITAENQRARLAEKRRVYARFFAAITDLLVLSDSASQSKHRERKKPELNQAMGLAVNAMSEVLLIAPEQLGQLSLDHGEKAVNAVTKALEDPGSNFYFTWEPQDLLNAMRADLGDPPIQMGTNGLDASARDKG
jgi:hypothetical protein